MSFIQTQKYNKKDEGQASPNTGQIDGTGNLYGGDNPYSQHQNMGKAPQAAYNSDESLYKEPMVANTNPMAKPKQKIDPLAAAKSDDGKSGFKTPEEKKTGVMGAVTSLGTSALNDKVSDGDAGTYTTKEAAVGIAGSFLKGAATGAATGALGMGVGAIPGAIIGGVTGLVTGIFGAKKKKKAAKKIQAKKKLAGRDYRQKKGISDIMKSDALLGKAAAVDEVKPVEALSYGQFQFRRGGTFRIKALAESRKPKTPIFKKGGTLATTVNIIPNGVLHEEENQLGDKGMPVVKCNLESQECTKKYEIEKEELILTLENTKRAEELAKGGKMEELGSFLVGELLDNTHSFSTKFNYLNKMS